MLAGLLTNRIKSIAGSIFSHWALVFYNMLISFFLSPFIVNTLGNLYFGLWVTLIQFTSYMYLLDFGIRNTIVHRTAQAVGGKRTSTLVYVVDASIKLSTIIALFAFMVSLFLAFSIPHFLDLEPIVENDAMWVIIISGLTISIAIWNNPNEGVVRGFGLFLLANSFGFFTLTIRTALTVILLMQGYQIVALALSQLVVSIIHVFFIMLVSRHYLRKRGFHKKKYALSKIRFIALMKSVWNYSWSILIDNFSQKLIFTSDTIIISTVLTVPLVTFYAIANQLVEYLRRLIDSSMQVILPLASELTGAGHNNDLKSLLVQSTRFTAWFSMPVLTMYLVMGETFVGLWMGPEYAKAANEILVVLAVTQMIALQHYGITVVMRSLEKHNIIGPLRLAEATINIILSVILANKIGLLGVALGTAISHTLVTSIIMPYIVIKEIKMKYLEFIIPSYFKTLVVCMLIAAIGNWLNTEYHPETMGLFFTNVIFVMIIYLLVSYAFVLNQMERKKVNQIIKNRIAAA